MWRIPNSNGNNKKKGVLVVIMLCIIKGSKTYVNIIQKSSSLKTMKICDSKRLLLEIKSQSLEIIDVPLSRASSKTRYSGKLLIDPLECFEIYQL